VEDFPELRWKKKESFNDIKEDDDFRIDGYKFLPRIMIPEFKAFQYQAVDSRRLYLRAPCRARECRF
jgi:hypothetical protein